MFQVTENSNYSSSDGSAARNSGRTKMQLSQGKSGSPGFAEMSFERFGSADVFTVDEYLGYR